MNGVYLLSGGNISNLHSPPLGRHKGLIQKSEPFAFRKGATLIASEYSNLWVLLSLCSILVLYKINPQCNFFVIYMGINQKQIASCKPQIFLRFFVCLLFN